MRAAKRVVCYLKGSARLGLTYDRRTIGQVYEGLKTSAPFGLIGYADSNFAGNPEDRKSVMGYCFFIGGKPSPLGQVKKQRTVLISTTEAEYIALGHATKEGVWIRRFLNEVALIGDHKLVTEVTANGDNESSLALTWYPEAQNRTMHIDVQTPLYP